MCAPSPLGLLVRRKSGERERGERRKRREKDEREERKKRERRERGEMRENSEGERNRHLDRKLERRRRRIAVESKIE